MKIIILTQWHISQELNNWFNIWKILKVVENIDRIKKQNTYDRFNLSGKAYIIKNVQKNPAFI